MEATLIVHVSPPNQAMVDENSSEKPKDINSYLESDNELVVYNTCSNIRHIEIQKFYEIKLGISRFHETYNINQVLTDMFKVFQVYSDKIELDIAEIRKMENLRTPQFKREPRELIPLNIKNSLRESGSQHSQELCRTVQITDVGFSTAIKELKMYASNLDPGKNPKDLIKIEDTRIDPVFENIGELRDTFSTEMDHLVQSIKNKHFNTSKSERIKEILEYLKSDSKFTRKNPLEKEMGQQKAAGLKPEQNCEHQSGQNLQQYMPHTTGLMKCLLLNNGRVNCTCVDGTCSNYNCNERKSVSSRDIR